MPGLSFGPDNLPGIRNRDSTEVAVSEDGGYARSGPGDAASFSDRRSTVNVATQWTAHARLGDTCLVASRLAPLWLLRP
jgi:hypothetical protein